MANSTRDEKNRAMAARMKAEGVKRNVGRCPICNNLISINHLGNHIAVHK